MKNADAIVLLFCAFTVQFIYCMYQPQLEVGNTLRWAFQTGNNLGRNHARGQVYPMEYGLGHYYQGDIIMTPVRSGLIFNQMRWPKGVVPYKIMAPNFSTLDLQTIQSAIDQFKQLTCVRFVPRTNETYYISIWSNETGCHAHLGFNANNNYHQVNLQSPGCTTFVGTPVHELMHALGAPHEFTRVDRDSYVTINRSALQSQFQTDTMYNSMFAITPAYYPSTYSYSIPYNYNSVMHYSRYAGAANLGTPVLSPRKPWSGDFGNNSGLASSDVQLIRVMYCPWGR